MIYYAVIGDLVGSRELGERADVQRQLKNKLEDLNERYSEAIAAAFTITLGDEFQGLLTDPEPILKILDELHLAMYPVRFRFGVGIGTMSTEIDASAAIGADGPAYHAAREGIKVAKEMEEKYEQAYVDTLFYRCDASGRHYESMDMLNANLSLAGSIRDKWTAKQHEVIGSLEADNEPLRVLAEKLGVNHTSLQRRLVKADYYTYRANRQVCTDYIVNAREVSYEG